MKQLLIVGYCVAVASPTLAADVYCFVLRLLLEVLLPFVQLLAAMAVAAADTSLAVCALRRHMVSTPGARTARRCPSCACLARGAAFGRGDVRMAVYAVPEPRCFCGCAAPKSSRRFQKSAAQVFLFRDGCLVVRAQEWLLSCVSELVETTALHCPSIPATASS